MTLTIKLEGKWISFQLADNVSLLSVTDTVIINSARMDCNFGCQMGPQLCGKVGGQQIQAWIWNGHCSVLAESDRVYTYMLMLAASSCAVEPP